MAGKQAAKEELRRRLNLRFDDRPVVGIVTRLTAQKGIHLIKHAIGRTLDCAGRGGQCRREKCAALCSLQAEERNLASHPRWQTSALQRTQSQIAHHRNIRPATAFHCILSFHRALSPRLRSTYPLSPSVPPSALPSLAASPLSSFLPPSLPPSRPSCWALLLIHECRRSLRT